MSTKLFNSRKSRRSNLTSRKLACAVEALETRRLLAASVPDLLASSDSGASAVDNITNDNTPIFRGTASIGTTVRLFADGQLVGSANTTVQGQWQITSSLLADGNYDFVAAEVINGQTGPRSNPLAVRVDTVRPRATIGPVNPDPRNTPVGDV